MADSENSNNTIHFASLGGSHNQEENATVDIIDINAVSRKELRKMKVKKLKEFVQKHGVPCVFPCEKVDLVRNLFLFLAFVIKNALIDLDLI